MFTTMSLCIAGCRFKSEAGRVPKYAHSGDFSEQVVQLSARIALLKSTCVVGDDAGQVTFSLARVTWGGRPDMPYQSGYVVDNWLLSGLKRVLVDSSNGRIVLDSGTSIPDDPRFALVNLSTGAVVRSDDIEELKLQMGQSATANPLWLPISIYFDREVADAKEGVKP